MNSAQILSPLSQEQAHALFVWYAGQDQETQIEIVRQKNALFRINNKPSITDKAQLDFHCYCEAIRDGGWQAKNSYRQGRAISEEGARQISVRRKRRAINNQAHRVQVRLWLHKNWGKVLELRRADLGWGRVSRMIHSEHGIKISHTTLARYAKKFAEKL